MGMNNMLHYTLDFTANTKNVEQQLKKLQQSLSNVMTKNINTGIGEKISADLNQASMAASKLGIHLKNAINTETGQLNLVKLQSSINRTGDSVGTLSSQLLKAGSTGREAFMNLTSYIAMAQKPTMTLNRHMQALWTTMKNTMKWQISSFALTGLISGITKAIGFTKELNKNLNDIRIVTGASAEAMDKFANKANKAAKALGTTTNELTKATLIFRQQGDEAELAMKKAEITTKAANVAFDVSAQEMSQYLTAIWNSYQVGSQQLEEFVDKLAKVGATTATDMGELSTAMEKVAATAKTVGVSYDQLLATLSTVSSATRQSAEQVGTAFKTIYARLGDLKIDGSAIDEDGIKVTLGQVSSQLKNIGINILDANGEMKDMGLVVEEIGEKWQTMNSAQKAAVAQAIAGKRQYTQVMALFENWDKYEKTLEDAANAQGELNKQNDIYIEGWEGASKRLANSAQGLLMSILDDDVFVGMINGLSKILDFVDYLADSIGGFGPILLTFGGIMLNKFAPQIANSIGSAGQGFLSLIGYGDMMANKARSEWKQEIQNAFNLPDISKQEKLQLSYIEELITASENYANVYKNMPKHIQDANQQVFELIKSTNELAIANQQNVISSAKDSYSSSLNGLMGKKSSFSQSHQNMSISEKTQALSGDGVDYHKLNISNEYQKIKTSLMEYGIALDDNAISLKGLLDNLNKQELSTDNYNNAIQQIANLFKMDQDEIELLAQESEEVILAENEFERVIFECIQKLQNFSNNNLNITDPQSASLINMNSTLSDDTRGVVSDAATSMGFETDALSMEALPREDLLDVLISKMQSLSGTTDEINAKMNQYKKAVEQVNKASAATEKGMKKNQKVFEKIYGKSGVKSLKQVNTNYKNINKSGTNINKTFKKVNDSTQDINKNSANINSNLKQGSTNTNTFNASMGRLSQSTNNASNNAGRLKTMFEQLMITGKQKFPGFMTNLTKMGGGFMSLAGALSSVMGMWETFTNPDSTPLERLTSTLMTLGMVIMSLRTIVEGFNAVKTMTIQIFKRSNQVKQEEIATDQKSIVVEGQEQVSNVATAGSQELEAVATSHVVASQKKEQVEDVKSMASDSRETMTNLTNAGSGAAEQISKENYGGAAMTIAAILAVAAVGGFAIAGIAGMLSGSKSDNDKASEQLEKDKSEYEEVKSERESLKEEINNLTEAIEDAKNKGEGDKVLKLEQEKARLERQDERAERREKRLEESMRKSAKMILSGPVGEYDNYIEWLEGNLADKGGSEGLEWLQENFYQGDNAAMDRIKEAMEALDLSTEEGRALYKKGEEILDKADQLLDIALENAEVEQYMKENGSGLTWQDHAKAILPMGLLPSFSTMIISGLLNKDNIEKVSLGIAGGAAAFEADKAKAEVNSVYDDVHSFEDLENIDTSDIEDRYTSSKGQQAATNDARNADGIKGIFERLTGKDFDNSQEKARQEAVDSAEAEIDEILAIEKAGAKSRIGTEQFLKEREEVLNNLKQGMEYTALTKEEMEAQVEAASKLNDELDKTADLYNSFIEDGYTNDDLIKFYETYSNNPMVDFYTSLLMDNQDQDTTNFVFQQLAKDSILLNDELKDMTITQKKLYARKLVTLGVVKNEIDGIQLLNAQIKMNNELSEENRELVEAAKGAFLDEAEAAKYAGLSLKELMELDNDQFNIDTSQGIANILGIAQAAGIAGSAMLKLIEIMKLMEELEKLESATNGAIKDQWGNIWEVSEDGKYFVRNGEDGEIEKKTFVEMMTEFQKGDTDGMITLGDQSVSFDFLLTYAEITGAFEEGNGKYFDSTNFRKTATKKELAQLDAVENYFNNNPNRMNLTDLIHETQVNSIKTEIDEYIAEIEDEVLGMGDFKYTGDGNGETPDTMDDLEILLYQIKEDTKNLTELIDLYQKDIDLIDTELEGYNRVIKAQKFVLSSRKELLKGYIQDGVELDNLLKNSLEKSKFGLTYENIFDYLLNDGQETLEYKKLYDSLSAEQQKEFSDEMDRYKKIIEERHTVEKNIRDINYTILEDEVQLRDYLKEQYTDSIEDYKEISELYEQGYGIVDYQERILSRTRALESINDYIDYLKAEGYTIQNSADLRDLYNQKYELIQEDFEKQLSRYENLASLLETKSHKTIDYESIRKSHFSAMEVINAEIELLEKAGYTIENNEKLLELYQSKYNKEKEIIDSYDNEWQQYMDTIDLYYEAHEKKINKKIKYNEYLISQQEALITLQEGYNDTYLELLDMQHEAEQNFVQSKQDLQWLDAATRKMIYNEQDYYKEMAKIKEIQQFIIDLQLSYQEEISNLKEDEIYQAEFLTEQYEAQLEAKKEELNILKASLDIDNKRNALNTALMEKNVRIYSGGRWRQISNTEDVRDAYEDYLSAVYESEKAITENQLNDKTRSLEEEKRINEESNATFEAHLEAMKEEMEDLEWEYKVLTSHVNLTGDIVGKFNQAIYDAYRNMDNIADERKDIVEGKYDASEYGEYFSDLTDQELNILMSVYEAMGQIEKAKVLENSEKINLTAWKDVLLTYIDKNLEDLPLVLSHMLTNSTHDEASSIINKILQKNNIKENKANLPNQELLSTSILKNKEDYEQLEKEKLQAIENGQTNQAIIIGLSQQKIEKETENYYTTLSDINKVLSDYLKGSSASQLKTVIENSGLVVDSIDDMVTYVIEKFKNFSLGSSSSTGLSTSKSNGSSSTVTAPSLSSISILSGNSLFPSLSSNSSLGPRIQSNANGTNDAEAGISQVNELGMELLATNGGQFIELNPHEKIFNNDQMNFLYDLSKQGVENTDRMIKSIISSTNVESTHIENLTVELPNVSDINSFRLGLNELKDHIKNTQNFIKSR